MSRHRTAFNDEDFEDYDYDDEYYDEEEYGVEYAAPSTSSYEGGGFFDAPVEASSVAPVQSRDETIAFIMDVLGKDSIVSASRIGTMLDMFQGDSDATIKHFLDKLKSPVSAVSVAPKEAAASKVTLGSLGMNSKGNSGSKKVGLSGTSKVTHSMTGVSISSTSATKVAADSVSAKGVGIKLKTSSYRNNNDDDDDDKLSYNPEKLSMKLPQPKREDLHIVQDLDALGFGNEAKDIEVKPSIWTTVSASSHGGGHSVLLTDNAPLSDDEWDTTAAAAADSINSDKAHVTMIVSGHVDAGKSTIVGNLLYKIGQMSQRQLHKNEKESASIGKGSFALAWAMDETIAEREHGVTIDIAEKKIETNSKFITLLDSPGHRDFIPKMISGATFADMALLIVPASIGEYESSMGEKAQTREHAILLKALGVVQIIVVINKMDTIGVEWSQTRFELISHEVGMLLTELQFNIDKNVRFIPTSGLNGENIISINENNTLLRSWYFRSRVDIDNGISNSNHICVSETAMETNNALYPGLTLFEAIDTFRNPVRHINKPLRAIVTSIESEKEKTVTCRVSVQQGRLRCGKGVSLTECSGVATIKSIIDDNGNTIDILYAGQVATVILYDRSGRSGYEMSIKEGLVLCKGPPLVPIVNKFQATILTMPGLSPPILPGSTYELYLHGQEVQCKIRTLISMTTTKNKDKIKLKPKCISGGRSAVVIIEIIDTNSVYTSAITGSNNLPKVCVENFYDCKGLGRFALRAIGGTAAVGICDEVVRD
jgi:elongation factor 1 alpha-like protein